MARKTREESLNTKNRILDAAELVLLEKGVGQTAMADIAEAAGMSRGAVYGHFNGKIEVCVAVCDRAFSRAVEGFDLSDERPALATLRLAASHYLHQCGEPGSMQRVLEILYMKCEQSEENAPLMRRRALYELQTLRIAKALLRRAVAAGELDASLDASLDVHLAGVYLLSLLEGIFGSMIWTTRLRGDRWRDAEAMLDAGVDTLRASPALRVAEACAARGLPRANVH
ncbi:TetR family transcriptional regulator [Burkholderia pseudomallei]